MRVRKKIQDIQPSNRPADGEADEPTSGLVEEGRAELALADDIIRRSLSGQSEAFVRANRQHSGQ